MDSYTINVRIPVILVQVLILMYVGLATSDDSRDKEECAESLVGIATCLAYVGGTAEAPTPDCCNGLKQVLNTNRKCLCVIIKDRNDPDLGLNINITLALGLPQLCNAPANVSQCPALLNLPPNSPDAQIFYQVGPKSNNNNSTSPVAGGPNQIVKPSPASAATQSSGSDNGKRCTIVKTVVGLVFLWFFSANFIM